MPANDRIVAMNRIAEAGFPDHIWPVVFVAGCNLRCPYCLNASIVEPKPGTAFIPFDDVVKQLDEWGEDGVTVSGGECCMGEGQMVEMAKDFLSRGKKVGIATNGTFPLSLFVLVHDRLASFVGMDCKFSPFPSEVALSKASIVAPGQDPTAIIRDVNESLDVIRHWHDVDKDAKSEIRTTLYPPLVGEQDIVEIAGLVHPKSKWVLQQYRPNLKFDGAGNDIAAYPDEEVERLFGVAKAICKAPVGMRWP
jgi:pyruvate formate lyase activating enzyme